MSAFVTASAVLDWQSTLTFKGFESDRFSDLLKRSLFSAKNSSQRVVDLKGFVSTIEDFKNYKNHSGLAWSVGLASKYSKRGKVGQAILGSKSLGIAYRRLEQFYPLIQDRTKVDLDIAADWSVLGYRILDPDIWPRNEDALYTLGLFSSFIKTAAPEAWSSVEILVEAESHQIGRQLDDIVEANVTYGADQNGIRFPSRLLSKPLNLLPPVDNTFLCQLNRLLTEELHDLPMSERTRRMIFAGLSVGKVNQDHIARELGVSRRTLRRKLAAEDESFQSILDECRMRAAQLEFKINPEQSLSEMALKLGFSEHSTFSRAFMRWAGMAPQEFRKNI